ncbi:MAG: TonB-dependent receptor [Opitutaceae bacterium]|nr:TonB-dependent receptor [Opitutaceae bacterium]
MVRAALAWLAAAGVTLTALGQASSTGMIAGRIFNPATQEYVRNAEVSVEGTHLVAYSGDDGSYVLTNVPAGSVTLTVTYTGYDKASALVGVAAGGTAEKDFELKGSTFQAGARKDTAIVMGEFVVSTEREGNAKAIMEQRAAVNMKSVVAADNFGDVTGGNIGEFLKYLPGVVMDYNNSDARYARIGGLDPRYVGVSVDGMNVASAASASFDSSSRGFEFEQASITGVESIEISKSATASMDADAPAGRINMRSRNAFDRKGREITAQLTLTGNLNTPDLKKTPGPYEGDDYKIRPGFVFTYADSFKKRFGVQLSLGANTVYTDQAEVTNTFNYSNAARGPFITQIAFRDAPKLSTRASFNLTTDYKITPNLAFSLRTAGSLFDDGTNNRQLILTANAAQVDPASTLTHVIANPTANANTRLQMATSRRNKVNNTLTYTPKLEYKRGDFTATAGGGYSRSRTAYEQFTRGFFQGVTSRVTRMGWTAERHDVRSLDYHITQTSGLPWNDPASYNRNDTLANNAIINPQSGQNQVWVGYLDLKKTVNLGLPIQLGTGWKTKLVTFDIEKSGNIQWTYVGPTGNQLDAAAIIPTFTRYRYDPRQGGNVPTLNLPRPDPYTLYDMYAANPDQFRPNLISNYINENFSSRSVKEQVDSAYLEANTRWRNVRFNLGARHEQTRTIGKSQDLLPDAVVQAAGFTPNTIPYVNYQYRNGVRAKKYGAYENTFLSGGAKYAFTKDFHLQVAASQAIGRPGYNNLAGVITINDVNQTVRVPNPNLKPETSDKFFVSLQRYLEPAGTISLSGYKLWVENMGSRVAEVTAEEAGYGGDPEYLGYTFLRPMNAPGTQRIDGVDLEYSQQLVFLPGWWRGFSVFGSLSRTVAQEQLLDHVPKSANGGIRFSNYKFNAQLRCTWVAARLDTRNATEEVWNYERLMFDFSGGYRFNQTYELTLTGRNILNSPIARYSNEPGRLRSRAYFGPAWTIGVRGRW